MDKTNGINAHEFKGRHDKVQLITNILRAADTDTETAELFTDEDWQTVADLATAIRKEDDRYHYRICHLPSKATRALVIANLQETDPFEGVA